MGYVLAVARNHRVTTSPALGPQRADHVAAALSNRAWNRYSAGDGAKGRRDYDWAWVAIIPPADEQAGHHWLLIRRRLTDGQLAFYRCWSPIPVALPTLIRVAGTRWCVETCFQTSKNATGLDEHQVRRWDSWYRNTTLVMLAHAILTVIAAHERTRSQTPDQRLIPLTVNEVRRLFAKLISNTAHPISHWLAWSRWRRLHQARAKTSHYRRRRQLIDRPTST
jgi:SRSO17 transposase